MTGSRVFLGKVKPSVQANQVDSYLEKARVYFHGHPNVKHVRVGRTTNSPDLHKGYDFVIIIQIDDEKKVKDLYQSDESKQARATLLDPFVEDLIIADIEY